MSARKLDISASMTYRPSDFESIEHFGASTILGQGFCIVWHRFAAQNVGLVWIEFVSRKQCHSPILVCGNNWKPSVDAKALTLGGKLSQCIEFIEIAQSR